MSKKFVKLATLLKERPKRNCTYPQKVDGSMKVSIVIVTWNKKNLLKRCLESLNKQSYKNFQIILVDNGSTDGTINFIKKYYPRIKIVAFQKNLGFSKGANEGIKTSKSEYVILLNNDTIVDEDYIKNLLKTMNRLKFKGYCGCAPKMIDFFDRNVLVSAGDMMNDVGQSFPRGLDENKDSFNKGEEVFLVTGGASIFRRKVFEEIGFFDEDYFVYGEDSDWCFRAQLAGYKFYYEPKALVFHQCRATTKNMSKVIDYFEFRNMTITILKNFPLKLLFKKWRFVTIPLVHFNTIFYMAIKGCLKEAIRADFWIITHLIRIIKERLLIQSKRKVSIDYLDNWLVPKKLRFYGLLK